MPSTSAKPRTQQENDCMIIILILYTGPLAEPQATYGGVYKPTIVLVSPINSCMLTWTHMFKITLLTFDSMLQIFTLSHISSVCILRCLYWTDTNICCRCTCQPLYTLTVGRRRTIPHTYCLTLPYYGNMKRSKHPCAIIWRKNYQLVWVIKLK